MTHRHSRRIWFGRAVAAAAIAGLIVFFWIHGISNSVDLAVILTLVVAIMALVAPYLLPPPKAALPVPNDSTPGQAIHSPDADSGVVADKRQSRPARHMPSPSPLDGDKNAWISGLMAFSDIDDSDFRRTVLRLMGEELGLGHAFSASHKSMARDHVREIVDRCWDYDPPGAALRALVKAMISLRPEDGGTARLDALLG